MTSTPSRAYPGSAASAADLLALAHAYRDAAKSLLRRRRLLSRAPATLCAVHAIELYLNAFLLHCGSSPAEIRGHFHDLVGRGALAVERGLTLRRRTAEHLAKMTRDREYLVSRYGPEDVSTLSEINRLAATLEELATKVACTIEKGAGHVGLTSSREAPMPLPALPALPAQGLNLKACRTG